MLEIDVEQADGTTVCRPIGELDAYTVARFRDTLGELANRPRLVIDLSAVPFMDSAGLGALIGAVRRVREHQGEVAVASPRLTISKLLVTTGFDRIVVVSDSMEAAVQSFQSATGQAGAT